MLQETSQNNVFLAIGSNMGDRAWHIDSARQFLQSQVGELLKVSCLYETQPWGNPVQDPFLNQVVHVKTDLGPHALLQRLKGYEYDMGRKDTVRWGSRIIDIDILYYGHLILDRDDLQLPHPELTERNFVLVPLVEIAPDFLHPIFKLSNKELLEYCDDKSLVQLYV